jgi:hypothetical protein
VIAGLFLLGFATTPRFRDLLRRWRIVCRAGFAGRMSLKSPAATRETPDEFHD